MGAVEPLRPRHHRRLDGVREAVRAEGDRPQIGDGTELTEPGEIWIRGDNLFSGYWPDGRGGPGELGWFPTGDVGYLLDGELFLVDRARELIIVNGFNVYPAEVEDVIEEVPGVAEVAVIGVSHEQTGEAVVAYVRALQLSQDAPADVVPPEKLSNVK